MTSSGLTRGPRPMPQGCRFSQAWRAMTKLLPEPSSMRCASPYRIVRRLLLRPQVTGQRTRPILMPRGHGYALTPEVELRHFGISAAVEGDSHRLAAIGDDHGR